MELSPEQLKRKEKAASLKDGGQLVILNEIESVGEQVSQQVESVKQEINERLDVIQEDLKKKPELHFEIDPEEIRGLPGEDYVLTEEDKNEIATLAVMDLEVPVVEKVVEKTEVVREIPIVTENIVEVAKYKTPEEVRDDLESLNGDERLDKKAIKGLEKFEQIGFDRAIATLQQQTSFLINKVSNLANSISSGGGGGTPGGSDTQVQFNDGGAFGGDAGFTFNKTTDQLALTGPISLAQTTTNAVIIGNTSGNTRGSNAIDIQRVRTTVAYVASGTNAVAIGNSQMASGSNSVAVGGINVASGSTSVAVGYNNAAQALQAVALGMGNLAQNINDVSVGVGNSATGGESVLVGSVNQGDSASLIFGVNNLAAGGAGIFGWNLTNEISDSIKIGIGDSFYTHLSREEGSFTFTNNNSAALLKVHSSNSSTGACLIIEDWSGDGGFNYITFEDGVMSISTTGCGE